MYLCLIFIVDDLTISEDEMLKTLPISVWDLIYN